MRQVPTLVIDTTYGLTTGLVGEKPFHETDSRSHIERLQALVAKALSRDKFYPSELTRIIVMTGPGPFTGLRVGITFAKALAFATNATIVGQNILEPQAWWDLIRDSSFKHLPHLVLAVNNARRQQLYYQLFYVEPSSLQDVFDSPDSMEEELTSDLSLSMMENYGIPSGEIIALTSIQIDTPENIAREIKNIYETEDNGFYKNLPLTVIGHGASLTPALWHSICENGVGEVDVVDSSVTHGAGIQGLEIVEKCALHHLHRGDNMETLPIYVRRSDATIPGPLKPVLPPEEIAKKLEITKKYRASSTQKSSKSAMCLAALRPLSKNTSVCAPKSAIDNLRIRVTKGTSNVLPITKEDPRKYLKPMNTPSSSSIPIVKKIKKSPCSSLPASDVVNNSIYASIKTSGSASTGSLREVSAQTPISSQKQAVNQQTVNSALKGLSRTEKFVSSTASPNALEFMSKQSMSTRSSKSTVSVPSGMDSGSHSAPVSAGAMATGSPSLLSTAHNNSAPHSEKDISQSPQQSAQEIHSNLIWIQWKAINDALQMEDAGDSIND